MEDKLKLKKRLRGIMVVLVVIIIPGYVRLFNVE